MRKIEPKGAPENWSILESALPSVPRYAEIPTTEVLGGCHQDVDCALSIKNYANLWS